MVTGDENMEVKSNIGKLIDESPYKREYIQKHFGKSRNTISNWCVGNSYPSVPELFELAKILHCWVDDLYEEIKEEPNEAVIYIEELEFSPRVQNTLKRFGINTVNDLINTDLKKIPRLGAKGIEEVKSKLNEIDLSGEEK